MDVVYTYSHLGGEEILLVRYPEHHAEINRVIQSIANPGRNKQSKEKTKAGHQLYYAPKELNKAFDNGFDEYGRKELRDYYDIEIPGYPHVVKSAYKQCDFWAPLSISGTSVSPVDFRASNQVMM